MIQTQNYQIQNIYVEADGFRGPTCSLHLEQLITSEKYTTIIYNNSSTARWGIYELNLSPTQSGPRATVYGFTGPGLTVSYGQYRYDIEKNNQTLETGILWVFGQNNTIY